MSHLTSLLSFAHKHVAREEHDMTTELSPHYPPAAPGGSAIPLARLGTARTTTSSNSNESILPSPPASPPLRPRSSFARADSDVEAGKLELGALTPAAPTAAVHDEAGAMGPESPGVSRSNTLNLMGILPGSNEQASRNSEYDPLLLRNRLVGEEEIELRRRASSKRTGKLAGFRKGKKLGEWVILCMLVLC